MRTDICKLYLKLLHFTPLQKQRSNLKKNCNMYEMKQLTFQAKILIEISRSRLIVNQIPLKSLFKHVVKTNSINIHL